MHRIDTETAVDGRFVNKDPDHSIRATKLNAEWFNSVQEEICNLLEDNGVTLSDSSNEQLKDLFHDLLRGNFGLSSIGADGSFSGKSLSINVHTQGTDQGCAVVANNGGIFVAGDDGSNLFQVNSTGVVANNLSSDVGLFQNLGVLEWFGIGDAGIGFNSVSPSGGGEPILFLNGSLNIGSSTVPKSLSVSGNLNIGAVASFAGSVVQNSVPVFGCGSNTSSLADLSKPVFLMSGNFGTDVWLRGESVDSLGKVRIFVNASGGPLHLLYRSPADLYNEDVTLNSGDSAMLVCVGVNDSGYGKYAKIC